MNLVSRSMYEIIADRFTAYFTGRLPFCMVTCSPRKASWLPQGGIQGFNREQAIPAMEESQLIDNVPIKSSFAWVPKILPSCFYYCPIEIPISLCSFGDFPASHVWVPDGSQLIAEIILQKSSCFPHRSHDWNPLWIKFDEWFTGLTMQHMYMCMYVS